MTLSGLSRFNVENALAAASAALAIGIPRAAVVEGLSTFPRPGAQLGPDEHLLRPGPAARDRDHRQRPQRGRPRGAARGHERPAPSRARGCCSASAPSATAPTSSSRCSARSARASATWWRSATRSATCAAARRGARGAAARRRRDGRRDRRAGVRDRGRVPRRAGRSGAARRRRRPDVPRRAAEVFAWLASTAAHRTARDAAGRSRGGGRTRLHWPSGSRGVRGHVVGVGGGRLGVVAGAGLGLRRQFSSSVITLEWLSRR